MKAAWLVALLLVLSGCAYIGPRTQKPLDVPVAHAGTQGITARFLAQAPPDEVYEGSLINILLDVQNQGATDVRRGGYAISAPEQYVIFEEAPSGFLDIKGRTPFDSRGGKQRISLRAMAVPLGTQIESMPVNLLATFCYPYETQFSTNICVDADMADDSLMKACHAPEAKTFKGGQGAPVAVTKIETTMLPHVRENRFVPQVAFEIANLGKGRVLARGAELDACAGKPIDSQEYDEVHVQAFLSEMPMQCQATARLQDKRARVVCRLDEGIPLALGTYPSPLRVTLSYGYAESLSKSFRIQRLARR